ncbi:MAG: nucleotide exchange factor GrpE [Acidobacteria bacterium]|nr:nucleotide exchange factor GrpE [Acidobacteriota bacterium]MBK7932099.1 nucleotide exchange factor GrpE [Acidobacteriota bacterium]
MPTDSLDDLDMDSSPSVEDFIRELEAKEKDLHITADLSIEIEDSDVDMNPAQAFVEQDLNLRPAAPDGNASPATKARNFELENEIASLKLKVMELRNERNEIQEKSDRRLKDFENFKYRMDREKRGSFIDQIANLAAQMLPVLDNLNRALDSVPSDAEKKSPEFQQLYDGIVLVNQQLNEVFAGMGVTAIPTEGEEFDPNFHEAVATEERDDMPTNMVSDELLRGYRIGNKVIRHSMVKVTTSTSTHKSIPPQTAEPAAEIESEPHDPDASTTEA